MIFRKIAAPEWQCGREAIINVCSGGLEFADTSAWSRHFIAVSARYLSSKVSLRIVASPSSFCDTWLAINHWATSDFGYLSPEGEVRKEHCEHCEHFDVVREENGHLRLELNYIASRKAMYLGSAKVPGELEYAGSGNHQWTIHSVEVATEPLEFLSIADRIVLVDVGAAGGIDGAWLPELERIHLVLIEPDPDAAEYLRTELIYPSRQVVQVALFNSSGIRNLNVTKFRQCSSLLKPDNKVLSRYKVAPCFEVIDQVPIECTRYDKLPSTPAPDMLKVDVQGAEYEVLEGFGSHLDTILGIELEAHFYPIYRGQKLIGNIVSMLENHGLRLRKITPQLSFDRDYVEVNAYFTRDDPLSTERVHKLDLIHRVLRLHEHAGGQQLAALFSSEALK